MAVEMLKKDYKPFKTGAKYMSDLAKDVEWFYDV